MASVRKKESKIPLTVDSKLKNVSKIPLRVGTKPKTLINAEPELKMSSTVAKKKAAINTINRNKTSTVEISKKELKSVNLTLKDKAKENKFQQSRKISLAKEPNNGAPKTTTNARKTNTSNKFSHVLQDRNKVATKVPPEKPKLIKDKEENRFCEFNKKVSEKHIQDDDPFKIKDEGKQIKNLNHPSQIQKDRNKIATKVPFEKPKLIKDEEENPFCKFTKKIPEINIQDDDPFKIKDEGKQIKNLNHPSQKNIEFVADERMKNFILSNRELTPGMLKSCSKTKTSMLERPSLYRRFKLSVDPYKQALADIKNYDLKRQMLPEMEKIISHASPSQNRNSLYKPLKCVGKPYEDALKSLAELRIHQNIESIKKKVTFKISGEGSSTENETKDKNHSEKAVEAIQPQLTKINEKSCRSDILQVPEVEGNSLTPNSNHYKTFTLNSPSKTDEVLESRQISDLCFPEKIEEQKRTDCFINKISISTSPLKKDTNNEKVYHHLSPIINPNPKSHKNATISIQKNKNSILKSINPFLNSLRTSDIRQSLFSNQSECFFDKMNPKICTPQPVSLYPQLILSESVSPEFLSKRTTDILSCAPINTPLVLKSLSKRELSPVCKKLEFKNSPKEASDSKENSQTFYLQNIMTQQKILDQLAHQECSIFMHEAAFPCEIRNYLQNPVAQILNDGDEMHFLPVPLRRVS